MALPRIITADVIRQTDVSYVIFWKVALPSIVPPTVRLRIHRSYAAASGYEVIATVNLTDGVYIDSEHQDFSKDLTAFYRLEVFDSVESATYGPYEIEASPDVHARFMIRQMRLMLRNIGATPVLIYQAARGDETKRCPECWDVVSQMIIASNCTTCAGSGFVGEAQGFYLPVLTLMDIRPADNAKSVEDTAQSPRISTGRMSNFPRLRISDVVREVNTGRLWIVVNVTPIQKDQRALISQDPVTLKEVKHRDVEYDLPIPAVITPILTRRRTHKEKILRLVNDTATLVDVWV